MANTTSRTQKPGADPAPEGDSAEAQLRAIRAEVAALAGMMSDFAKGQADALRGAARTIAREAADRAGTAKDGLKAGVDQAEKVLDDRVREHPLQSILMAFGLGMLISLLFRR